MKTEINEVKSKLENSNNNNHDLEKINKRKNEKVEKL